MKDKAYFAYLIKEGGLLAHSNVGSLNNLLPLHPGTYSLSGAHSPTLTYTLLAIDRGQLNQKPT